MHSRELLIISEREVATMLIISKSDEEIVYDFTWEELSDIIRDHIARGYKRRASPLYDKKACELDRKRDDCLRVHFLRD